MGPEAPRQASVPGGLPKRLGPPGRFDRFLKSETSFTDQIFR